VIDYCHNVDGMRNLADFTRRMMSDGNGSSARTGRAIGVIGMPGDRRDDDMREYGALAAGAFDELIVREDRNLRGRKPGATAELVAEGARATRGGGPSREPLPVMAPTGPVKVDKILDELTAVRTALRRANRGDLLVMCVDDAVGVYKEAMAIAGKPVGATAFADPGELEAPEG
jgi:cyanophycin synthetase